MYHEGATLPDPDSHKFNVCSSGWTLLPMLSKKEGCGLRPHVFPPGLESRHPFWSRLCALCAGFIFLHSTGWTSPMSAAGAEPSLEAAGMPWTRWLKKFELMSVLCCQKYKFSLSCPSTSDLFGLYLISASFPGILNTQNKSCISYLSKFDTALVIGKRLFTAVIFSQLPLCCRNVCWNYLWIHVNVCVIYVHSFTLSYQPPIFFHLFIKTYIKTNQLLADNRLLMLPTASYSLQLIKFVLSKTHNYCLLED